MTGDDAVYALVLLISLFIGPLIRKCGFFKPWCSAMIGFFMFFCVAGHGVWHSMVTVSGFLFLSNLFSPRFFHYVAVIWCFGYLAFFRTCHLFGYAQVSPAANIVQLLLTLRLIGLSFELNDTWKIENKLQQTNLPLHDQIQLKLLKEYKSVHYSPLMVILYAYCYIGLFTGPYYKMRTFQDFINPIQDLSVTYEEPFSQHLQEAPIFGVAYLILSHFYTIDYVRTAEFYDRHFTYRFFYMVIIFITFRMRIYFAWKMSECVCMSAGLGAYPKLCEPEKGEGPTNLHALDACVKKTINSNLKVNSSANSLKPNMVDSNCVTPAYSQAFNSNFGHSSQYNVIVINYQTIINLSVWGCEFAPTVRDSMKSWNCSVQYWLATCFYRRCKGPRLLRTLWTMCVSAYWHGISPGYYLSFLTIPLALLGESSLNELLNLFGTNLPTGSLSFLLWLLKMRVFEYCAMGFLIRDWSTTLAYWSSINYCIHIILISLIVLNYSLRLILPKRIFKPIHTKTN